MIKLKDKTDNVYVIDEGKISTDSEAYQPLVDTWNAWIAAKGYLKGRNISELHLYTLNQRALSFLDEHAKQFEFDVIEDTEPSAIPGQKN